MWNNKAREGKARKRVAKITWSLKLAKLKRSKGRPWSDSPSLATRTKNTKRLRFQNGGSGFKFPRSRNEGPTWHSGNGELWPKLPRTGNSNAVNVIPDDHVDRHGDYSWYYRNRSVSRPCSMKGTVIYLDGPSDIDFKCRVCKSKKWANVHGYLYWTWFIDSTAKSLLPVHPNIGVKRKKLMRNILIFANVRD